MPAKDDITVEEANTKCDEHKMLCSQVIDLRSDVKQIKYISWTTLIGFAGSAFWYIIKLNETVIHEKTVSVLSKIITTVVGCVK